MPRQRVQANEASNSSRGKAVGSSLHGKASLSDLPLELRQEIYSYLVYTSRTALLNLQVTNRRIAKEAKPFLYQRPPLFDGQYEMFDWLENVDHDYLPYVTDISIKLVDIDPETIVGALGKRLREAKANREPLRSGPRDNPYYEACYQDLKRIQKVFSLLPGVRMLTLVEARQGDTQPPMPMLENFSKLLGHCFPNLLALVSTLPLLPIHCIANKPKLRRLRFPANSQSSEDEVAAVCRKLAPNLELEIFRHDPFGEAGQYQWGCAAEVLANVPSLGALSLVEDLDDQPSDLLEEVFVDSIETLKRHLRSLHDLKLMAEPPEDAQKASVMKRNLLRVLESSRLRHVEVMEIYSSIYRHLPSSIEKFVLRLDRWCCEPDGSFSDVLEEFLEHVKFRAMNKDPAIPKLTNLRSIEVWIHQHEDLFDVDDDDEHPRTLERKVKAQLARIGVQFRLVIKNPNHGIYDE